MSTRENPLWRRISIRWTRCPILWMSAKFYLSLFSLLNGLLNKMAMVAGIEFRHKLHNMDLHQGWSGYSHCWVPTLPTAEKHQIPLLNHFPGAARKRLQTVQKEVSGSPKFWQEADWENDSRCKHALPFMKKEGRHGGWDKELRKQSHEPWRITPHPWNLIKKVPFAQISELL